MTKHTECGCQCITKEADCNHLQRYFPDKCRCECTNIDEKRMCEDQSETKLWDKSSCSCRCLEVQSECQTGMVFSFASCRCEPRGHKDESKIHFINDIKL